MIYLSRVSRDCNSNSNARKKEDERRKTKDEEMSGFLCMYVFSYCKPVTVDSRLFFDDILGGSISYVAGVCYADGVCYVFGVYSSVPKSAFKYSRQLVS